VFLQIWTLKEVVLEKNLAEKWEIEEKKPVSSEQLLEI